MSILNQKQAEELKRTVLAELESDIVALRDALLTHTVATQALHQAIDSLKVNVKQAADAYDSLRIELRKRKYR